MRGCSQELTAADRAFLHIYDVSRMALASEGIEDWLRPRQVRDAFTDQIDGKLTWLCPYSQAAVKIRGFTSEWRLVPFRQVDQSLCAFDNLLLTC